MEPLTPPPPTPPLTHHLPQTHLNIYVAVLQAVREPQQEPKAHALPEVL
jgi:hypothetical protein